MSVEQRIKELLGKKAAVLEEGTAETDAMSGSTKKDTSIVAAHPGDLTQPRQGDSQDADIDERDEDEENQGAVASKTIGQNTLTNGGPGAAPYFTTVDDPTRVVNLPASTGNPTPMGESVKDELRAILGEDASTEFVDKATGLFEAAVVARSNAMVDSIRQELAEQAEEVLAEQVEAIVEEIDQYLDYIVEKWLESNAIAIDRGVRAEIAEGFIEDLKLVFERHNIEIPEDKVDLVEALAEEKEQVEAALSEAIDETVALRNELEAAKKAIIVAESVKELTATEQDKLATLLEGVEFGNEDSYREKVKVIKESHFSKNKGTAPSKYLTEDVTTNEIADQSNPTMQKYARALSKSVKG